MSKTVSGEVNGLGVAVIQERMTPAQAARKAMRLYEINDERGLLVELKELKLIEPLSRFLNDHYADRKQRIVITDEWNNAHFEAFVTWLAAPAKPAPAQKAPEPRRHEESRPNRGRNAHRQYVATHS